MLFANMFLLFWLQVRRVLYPDCLLVTNKAMPTDDKIRKALEKENIAITKIVKCGTNKLVYFSNYAGESTKTLLRCSVAYILNIFKASVVCSTTLSSTTWGLVPLLKVLAREWVVGAGLVKNHKLPYQKSLFRFET